jgi:sulfur-carrier protein
LRRASRDEVKAVAIIFHIPASLREFTSGQRDVEIATAPTTLADALSALWLAYPGLRDRVTTEQGEIREHINIFIGDDDVRFTGGLATRIAPGCEISIVPSISGG